MTHSASTASMPRTENCRNRRACLIWPLTGSTTRLPASGCGPNRTDVRPKTSCSAGRTLVRTVRLRNWRVYAHFSVATNNRPLRQAARAHGRVGPLLEPETGACRSVESVSNEVRSLLPKGFGIHGSGPTPNLPNHPNVGDARRHTNGLYFVVRQCTRCSEGEGGEFYGKCPTETRHRQLKYLNNFIEVDHGKLKQLIRPRARVAGRGRRPTPRSRAST